MTILLLGGIGLLCCSSSAALGYAWYDNMLCSFSSDLGKACPPPNTNTPAPLPDEESDDEEAATTTETSPTGGGGGGGGGKDNDKPKKDSCAKYKVQLGYTPTLDKMPSTGVKEYKLYDSPTSKKSTKVKMTDDFYAACRKQYVCKIGTQFYQVRYGEDKAFNKVDKVTNYKGDLLSAGSVGGPGSSDTSAFFKLYKMGSSLKINNKSLKLKDVCEDCKSCEVSVYTGEQAFTRNVKPKPYDGLEDGKEYTLKKA